MNISDEIERKYLIKYIPHDLEKYPKDRIEQGYIIYNDDTEVRVRKLNDEYFLTIKVGKGEVRREVELKLFPEQFDQLWDVTEGRRIEKTRYKIDYDSIIIEVDVYNCNLEGFISAEVEFKSVEESQSFQPPEWFGNEVTNDERYKNRNLAINGLPEKS